MPAPERRTPADLVAAAGIAVVVALAAAVLWWTSDVRGTTVHTAAVPLPSTAPPAPTALPPSLAEVWRAPSSATDVPVVAGATVVTGAATGGATGNDSEVTGREPTTGAPRWSYRRDEPLCTVGPAFERVLAVHRKGDSCSAVTALEPADGSRGPQRTGPLGPSPRLLAQPAHVIATGVRYLEVWRNDLVRTLQYGALPSPVKPGAQPRTGCSYGSTGAASGLVGVVERCPGESADRLTVQQSDPDEPDQPEIVFSTLLPDRGAVLVAMTGDRVAVALPGPARLVVLDDAGRSIAEHPLDVPDADLRADPPGGVAAVSPGAGVSYWFTGSATVALEGTDLRPLWRVPGTFGPGTLLAGRLLVPVPDGLAVLDTASGQRLDLFPVDRGTWTGSVRTATVADVVLEQRGDTLVALRAR